ncbi:hypothetical protein BC835DRAFT_1420325 [Cytidiella melzeri]|nr:hypothetical protein BC835DRAFT_1420325 [Cytidiella melzeri]
MLWLRLCRTAATVLGASARGNSTACIHESVHPGNRTGILDIPRAAYLLFLELLTSVVSLRQTPTLDAPVILTAAPTSTRTTSVPAELADATTPYDFFPAQPHVPATPVRESATLPGSERIYLNSWEIWVLFLMFAAHMLVLWFNTHRQNRRASTQLVKQTVVHSIQLETLIPPVKAKMGDKWYLNDAAQDELEEHEVWSDAPEEVLNSLRPDDGDFCRFIDDDDESSGNITHITVEDDSDSFFAANISLPDTTLFAESVQAKQAEDSKRSKRRGGRQARARKENYMAKHGLCVVDITFEPQDNETLALTCVAEKSGLSKRRRFNKITRPRGGKRMKERRQVAREREVAGRACLSR